MISSSRLLGHGGEHQPTAFFAPGGRRAFFQAEALAQFCRDDYLAFRTDDGAIG